MNEAPVDEWYFPLSRSESVPGTRTSAGDQCVTIALYEAIKGFLRKKGTTEEKREKNIQRELREKEGEGETKRKRKRKKTSDFVKSPAYTFVAGTQIAWQQHSLNHFLPSLSFPSLLWHTCPFFPLVNSPLERFRGTCRCAPTREISQGPPANDEKKAPLTIQERTQGGCFRMLWLSTNRNRDSRVFPSFFFVPLLFRGEARGNVSFFYPVADGQKFKLFRILERKRTNERC